MKSLEVGGFADEEKVYPFVEIVSEWSRVGSQFGIKDNVVENTVDISSMKMFVTQSDGVSRKIEFKYKFFEV